MPGSILAGLPGSVRNGGYWDRLLAGTHLAQVRGGYAVPLSESAFLYGQTWNGTLVELCLSGSPDALFEDNNRRRVSAFCSAHNLLLVDWYRAEILDFDDVARPTSR